MISTAGMRPLLLALGLLIAQCSPAAEHKAADAPDAPAPKAATPAKAKSAAPKEEKSSAAQAEKEEKEQAPKPVRKPAGSATTAERAPAPERKPAEAVPTLLVRAAPLSRPPPPRVVAALARERHDNAAGTHGAAIATPSAAAATSHTPHWSYEGKTGPHAWAKLAPEYAACGSGTRQSPIDIRDGMKVDLDPIVFDYRPSGFKVIDNGHTIQANVGGWNSMRIMGRRFRLVQFHFHSPSEEMIDGKLYDMVAHLVHKDAEGRLAVVAVLFENGARQPALQTVLNNLPLEKGEEFAASSPIDLHQLLPENRKYFTYMGSLTTPPCSEDVLWIVMKQPVQATAEQLNLIARLYPMNARPVQEARDRIIKESN